MRYFCSDMKNPSNWIETTETDEMKIVKHYASSEMYVYDADNSGNNEVFFAFSSGNHYRINHAWWMDYNPQWEIFNEFEYKKIPASEAKGICADHDYLKLVDKNKEYNKFIAQKFG